MNNYFIHFNVYGKEFKWLGDGNILIEGVGEITKPVLNTIKTLCLGEARKNPNGECAVSTTITNFIRISDNAFE